MGDNDGVQARFLLGPAGTGKTFLCLAEIRQALLAEPSGPPLVLLAPKQATFQLERQLLADPSLPGYTRLQILSFERLADYVLEQLRQPPPPLLSEDGRTMVLRALLARRRKELQIFHASAGLAGFARQLSLQLRELQRRRLAPEGLRALAAQPGVSESLRRKLQDLSRLLEDYLDWLRQHHLQDADSLLDLAAGALERPSAQTLSISALWLDGFAEMTPQELDLLAALALRCQKMTLAFCLEGAPSGAKGSWLSIWTGIGKTFQQCRTRFSALPGACLTVEVLARHRAAGRFTENPVLRHLEEHWEPAAAFPDGPGVKLNDSLRLAVCADPAAEAVLAAREILQFARAGGRLRDAAVLLRGMEGYHDHLRRVFSRYEIPFFLDRRELVGQHPLAELTRSALGAAVFGWRHDDWFGALKTGLVAPDEEAIDRLENEALARGWAGEAWFAPLPPDSDASDWAERSRQKWLPPFAKFRNFLCGSLSFRPNGPQLAQALRQLWRDLAVENTLENWSAGPFEGNAVHATVWQQLNAWLDDVALAFAGESMRLRDWLPILEAGLTGLSIGVIPPALDQVLVGTIDRSRNPDLKLVLLLGVNESVFPAAPSAGHLLGDADREELGQWEIFLGPSRREFLSRERFFGYIACTRSRQRLVVTCAERDDGGQPLNPSPFFSHLRRLFPKLTEERFAGPDWTQAEHPCELAGQVTHVNNRTPVLRALLERPAFASLREQMALLPAAGEREGLAPDLAGQLYGPALRTSVSRLEDFAACSFKFFVRSGLRAEERQRFELDVRERGSFQHEALALFHRGLRAEQKNWRDLSPDEARRRVGEAVAGLTPQFREGLLAARAQTRFAARAVADSLQDFVAATVSWMDHYQFDPCQVELGFGRADDPLPAWELDLGAGRRLVLRGIIDRVDLCRRLSADEALTVVIDYKSSARRLDKILMAHGLQLQLTAYLGVLRHLADPKAAFGVGRLVPAGVFYVNLRGQTERGETRTEVLETREEFQRRRYQHSGRFDGAALPWLDSSQAKESAQFNFKLKADGHPDARSADVMSSADFRKLLDHVEAELIRMGREIYGGALQPNPFQKGRERACDHCEYQGICRFDPWTDSYRVLGRPGEPAPAG
ncbi:MAG: PD-(D/E)XK nuclease family protein [Verrucomicrobiota bacterium]